MRRLGETATLLLSLLGTLHGVRASFDDSGVGEEEYDYGENETESECKDGFILNE